MKPDYLESKVNTASPAQLHLMLIEGAVRFARQAEQAMLRDEEVRANSSLTKVIDIVAEMLAGVRHADTEINRRLEELYQFVFATAVSAYVNFDSNKLADVLRVLEFERETWRLACERTQAADGPKGAPIPAAHLPRVDAPTGVSFQV
ncbi:Flagellar protein FliS [Pirellulimonas nuda]|uniref:Flagellar protein FliS n=1 Tax=Pirellulimonas nuda TaxID=2528009 RepID=A0A518DJW2_9BACT|nr:flagellar export chaperone FliS [Pirellulimonas nuda]QDU91732.1 Flagellar protein FliS [Pirellulimonas nuda]